MQNKNKIYIVSIENSNMPSSINIGYATSSIIAEEMIKEASKYELFNSFEFSMAHAPINCLKIGDKIIEFKDEEHNNSNGPLLNNDDILMQFAVLWGIQLGGALSPVELKVIENMKLLTPTELQHLFALWRLEFLSQQEITSVPEFFQAKLMEALCYLEDM